MKKINQLVYLFLLAATTTGLSIELDAMKSNNSLFTMKTGNRLSTKKMHRIISEALSATKHIYKPKSLQPDKLDRSALEILHYASDKGKPLYIPSKILSDESFELKDFYAQNEILLPLFGKSSTELFLKISPCKLKERAQKEKDPNAIHVNDLPKVLESAKSILKSFLLTDDKELSILEQQYIKKEGINRLFAYAYMRQVIKDENLSHIHLPRKVLVIKDLRTGKYVSSEDAPKVIDNILEVIASQCLTAVSFGLNWTEGGKAENYEISIFAHKEKDIRELSEVAYKDLIKLCKEAPFDVGAGNIFGSSNGDAMIIDTEYKGEASDICIRKLNRYRN